MEMYLADLRKWPLEVALKAIERWPERSEWWPSWHELLGLLGELQSHRLATLPRPRPEHQPLPRGDYDDGHKPFICRGDWADFADAMRRLRDSNAPMLARDALLAIGEKIEERQLPHAQARGWA